MKNIQKVYLLHDTFYASLSHINPQSIDGKDIIKTVYALTENEIIIESSDNIFFYDTLVEASEMLKECNEY